MDAIAMKTGLIFAGHAWLWALPALAIGGWLLWLWSRRLARRRLARFVDTRLFAAALPTVNWRGKNWRFAISVAVLLLLALTLARPLTGPRPDQAESKGVDFVIALDASKSMWVEDVEPNRLAAVKKELGEWFKTLAGDRAGLVVFAGDAFVQAPVTFDYTALDYVLQQVGPKSVSLGGTNIPRAIEVAEKLLVKHERGSRFLVIISDGENLEGDALAAVRKAYAEQNIRVFTVGVGTLAGGPVPGQDYSIVPPSKDGKPLNKQYMQSEYGFRVTSKLDDRALRAVAEAGGGRYCEFKPGQQTFQTLHRQGLLPLARQGRSMDVKDYNEWFQVPLMLAVLLLLALPFIPETKRRTEPKTVGVATVKPTTFSRLARRPLSTAGKTLTVAVLLSLVSPLLAQITDPLAEAESLLKEGKADKAVEWMREMAQTNEKDTLMFYNYALTVYRAGRYEEAIKLFQSLQLTAKDAGLLDKIDFQMGNAQVRLGQDLEKRGQMPAAILAYERAVSCYAAGSGRGVRDNKALTEAALEGVLVKSGDEQIKSADYFAGRKEWQLEEQRLRNALQAFERATEINPDNKEATEKAVMLRERLVKNLATQAERFAERADQHLEESKKMEPQKKNAAIEESLKRRTDAVAKLDQALEVQPENREIAEKKQEQLNKMSDTLTDRAQEGANKSLPKEKLNDYDIENLQQAKKNLDRAQQFNPDNQRAAELNDQVTNRLEQELIERGEQRLELANKFKDTNKAQALPQAQNALSNFEKALEVNPDNQCAQEGAEKTREIMPDLLANAAQQDVDNAKKAMEKGNDATAKDLQKAVSHLEKADATMDRALAMDKKQNEDIKKQAEAIRDMLGDTRDKLDQKQRAESQQGGEKDGEKEKPGEEEKGEKPGPDGEKSAPQLKLQSMQDLRPKPKNPKNEDNFWNRKFRDW